MYLKRLFIQNKFWFLLVIIFIAGQLFINYKRGVVFSPFFHYGMYSEVIKPQEHYIVTEIFINNKMLSAKDFSAQQWDNIIQPAEKFYTQKEWNSNLWNTDIKRMLPFKDSTKFINTITVNDFNKWYKQRLESITGTKVSTFNIKFQPYTYNGSLFIKETAQQN